MTPAILRRSLRRVSRLSSELTFHDLVAGVKRVPWGAAGGSGLVSSGSLRSCDRSLSP